MFKRYADEGFYDIIFSKNTESWHLRPARRWRSETWITCVGWTGV